MSKAMRQMPAKPVEGEPGRASVARGEALRDLASDEACGPPLEHPCTGSARPKAGTGGLLEAALTRENLQTAWKRVKANKGAAGVDGLDMEQTAQLLRQSWPDIRQALLAGSYATTTITFMGVRYCCKLVHMRVCSTLCSVHQPLYMVTRHKYPSAKLVLWADPPTHMVAAS